MGRRVSKKSRSNGSLISFIGFSIPSSRLESVGVIPDKISDITKDSKYFTDTYVLTKQHCKVENVEKNVR